MATWTIEQKVAHLLSLPWTITVSAEDDEMVARVAEIPGVLAVASQEKQLLKDITEALESVLGVMVEHEDSITIPGNRPLPWESGQARSSVEREVIRLSVDKAAFLEIRQRSSAPVASAAPVLSAVPSEFACS